MTIRYIHRTEWGGGPVRSGHLVPHNQFVGLVAHHTVMIMPDYDRDGFLHGDVDDVKRYMRQLQTARPDLGNEVPYSFVVFEGATVDDCIVAVGRGFGVTGAHTSGYNSTRYGVAVAGNTSTRSVTPGMLEGYRWIGRQLTAPASAQPTLGHRDTKSTECPGHSLYARLLQIQPPFASQEDEMTPAQESKLDRALASLTRIENEHFNLVARADRMEEFIDVFRPLVRFNDEGGVVPSTDPEGHVGTTTALLMLEAVTKLRELHASLIGPVEG